MLRRTRHCTTPVQSLSAAAQLRGCNKVSNRFRRFFYSQKLWITMWTIWVHPPAGRIATGFLTNCSKSALPSIVFIIQYVASFYNNNSALRPVNTRARIGIPCVVHKSDLESIGECHEFDLVTQFHNPCTPYSSPWVCRRKPDKLVGSFCPQMNNPL